MAVGKRKSSGEELQARVEAKCYNHDAHRDNDTGRDVKSFKSKTLKDQAGPLKLYE